MDYVMAYRLVQCLREGLVAGLRRVRRRGVVGAGAVERDVGGARGSAPMKFPDFTRGRWNGARTVL